MFGCFLNVGNHGARPGLRAPFVWVGSKIMVDSLSHAVDFPEVP